MLAMGVWFEGCRQLLLCYCPGTGISPLTGFYRDVSGQPDGVVRTLTASSSSRSCLHTLCHITGISTSPAAAAVAAATPTQRITQAALRHHSGERVLNVLVAPCRPGAIDRCATAFKR